MEIYGERGTIWLRTARGALAIYAPEHTGARDWVVPELPARASGDRQHQAFLDLVRGVDPSDGTGVDGLASVIVAEAIYRSSSSRREVAVGAHERNVR
jgi:predicted dehydrogenase